jgi:hypothetical protein
LINTHFKLVRLKNSSNIQHQQQQTISSPEPSPVPSTTSSSSNEIWENFETEFFQTPSNNTDQSNEITIRTKLERLCIQDRVPLSENILEFWEFQKLHDHDLGILAETVLAAPASQVSVERAFSGLALVLSSHRTRLKNEHLNSILRVKLNKDLMDKINLNEFRDNSENSDDPEPYDNFCDNFLI